jgi:glucose/arabinose dehydrogenase
MKLLFLIGLLAQYSFALEHTPETKGLKLEAKFELWAKGFSEITDIQWVPGSQNYFVLQKTGEIFVFDSAKKTKELFLKTDVTTSSELGLLGVAFDPQFLKDRKYFYLNRTVRSGFKNKTVVSKWDYLTRKEILILFEVEQPFPNHNGGQLKFGPDGLLYIGMGDGGSANDPYEVGQNPKSFLGKMLTLDTIKPNRVSPEIFAMGVRNPWRFTFSPSGELWIADVGQNKYEEISIAKKGDNLGWNIMEGNHCFSPRTNCKSEGLVKPVHEYGRDDGGSITGGEFYLKDPKSAAYGHYLFADFVSGRIWSLDPKTKKVYGLGKTDANISTFGRSPEGEIFFADFAKGEIYKISF